MPSPSPCSRWAPAIRGHGIPETMEAVLERQSRIAPRVAVAKPVSAALAIGTGGPFGAEGPIIVTGGAAGSLLGQLLPVSPSERKILLASGAAAGMAATFGAPMAAVVLAVELLLFEFSTRALLPLVLAASVAGAMHQVLFGADPLFSVPTQDFPGLSTLPVFALLGLASGLVACVIARGLFLFEAGFRRLPVGELWHPVIGAAGFGLVGLAAPAPSASATTRSAMSSRPAWRSPPSPCSRGRSCWPGGSRSPRAPPAARSRRSC